MVLDPGRPYALASITLGIISIPLAMVPVIGLISYALALVGIVAGLMGAKKATVAQNGVLARWGIALSVVAILFATVWVLVFVVFD
jgi:hypothetical protein